MIWHPKNKDELAEYLKDFVDDLDFGDPEMATEHTPYDRLCDHVRNATVCIEKHLKDTNTADMKLEVERIIQGIALYELETLGDDEVPEGQL